jgi:3-hydroxyisobutyrate dehydrogenase
MTKERIGYIGLGIMGLPMATNLLKAGYSLTVFSRTKSKADTLLAGGARWANTPAEVAKCSDVVITCLPDTPDVKTVLIGDNGVVTASKNDFICIDMSTIAPNVTQTLALELAKKGITLLDAPVSGGQNGAIEAKLSVMVGGPIEMLQKVRPILETVGRTITYCGSSGYGQITKLVNQVMVIHTIMSIAEGLAFAEKAGLNLQTTFDATSAGAAGSHSLKILGPKIIAGDLKPAFMIDLQQKDLRLVLEFAEQIKQPLPGVALIKQLFTSLQAQGRGKDGTHALVDVIRQLARFPV